MIITIVIQIIINDFKYEPTYISCTVSGRGWAGGGLGRSILVKDFRYTETSFLKVCNLPAISKYITFSVKIVFHNVSFLLLCLFC